jgi:hypothetical protein
VFGIVSFGKSSWRHQQLGGGGNYFLRKRLTCPMYPIRQSGFFIQSVKKVSKANQKFSLNK